MDVITTDPRKLLETLMGGAPCANQCHHSSDVQQEQDEQRIGATVK
jgi:hypothetical protein